MANQREEKMGQNPAQHDDYEYGPPPREANPWVERIISREAFYVGAARKATSLVKNGEPRCFIIRRPQKKNIHAGLRIWLRTGGTFDSGAPKAVPFYDDLEPWLYFNKEKGRSQLSTMYPPEDRALGDILKNKPGLVAQQFFNGEPQAWPSGDPKLNIDEFYAVEAFEVQFSYKEVADPKVQGGKKRIIEVDPATKKPKYAIDPKPHIWELRRPWWDQLHFKVLSPQFAFVTEVADPDGAQASKPKVLPTPDPSKVLLKLFAKTKDATKPDSANNVAYLVDFSDALVIESAGLVPVEPLPETADGSIDWVKVYPPADPKEIRKLAIRFDKRSESGDEEAPGDDGPGEDGGEPATAGDSEEAPPVPDDVPF
jgi:hypothetical protein